MISGKGFLFWTVLVGLIVACAPVTRVTPLIVRARFAPAAIAITGNSVIDHASKCDRDARSIPAMLAVMNGAPVLDLSYGGQSLTDSVNLAAVSLRNPHVSTMLLTVSLFSLMEENVVSLRDYIGFRAVNPSLPAEGLVHRLFSRSDQSGLSGPMQEAFSYDGAVYPAYDELKRRFLQPEREAMNCPETNGRDLSFIAALYDHTYLEYPVLPGNIALIGELGQEAQRRGKDFRVVVMPIDGEQIRSLLPASASRLQGRLRVLLQQLKETGVKVVDLSATVTNADFADRWCACGHLLEAGRRSVAEHINASLVAAPITTAATTN